MSSFPNGRDRLLRLRIQTCVAEMGRRRLSRSDVRYWLSRASDLLLLSGLSVSLKACSPPLLLFILSGARSALTERLLPVRHGTRSGDPDRASQRSKLTSVLRSWAAATPGMCVAYLGLNS